MICSNFVIRFKLMSKEIKLGILLKLNKWILVSFFLLSCYQYLSLFITFSFAAATTPNQIPPTKYFVLYTLQLGLFKVSYTISRSLVIFSSCSNTGTTPSTVWLSCYLNSKKNLHACLKALEHLFGFSCRCMLKSSWVSLDSNFHYHLC